MKLVKIGNEYVNPEQVVNVSCSRTMDGDKYVVSVYLIGGRVVKEVVTQRYSVKTVIERLTATSTDIKACAKRIRDCCRTYRENPETGYCQGCPFWYKSDYCHGCILRDGTNPGDWDLD